MRTRGVGLPTTASAHVALPGGSSELRDFPIPSLGDDDGLLRVVSSGICGTDVGLFASGLTEPTVLGHHVVGVLAAVGESAASRWNVAEGDHLLVEEYLPCGHCDTCATGWYRLCPETDLWSGGRRIGTIPASEEPSLFGGNAEYLYLPSNAVVHRLPRDLPWTSAVWGLPLANALDWVADAGALREGETVVVVGPGYHGLAAVAAAQHVGAASIVVCGLASDEPRLRLAADLGATTVVLPTDDLHGLVDHLTGGRGADVVLDTAGLASDALESMLALLAQRGRLVLASGKPGSALGLHSDEITRRMITVRGVRGRAPQWVERAVDLLATGQSGVERVPTEVVALPELGSMLTDLANGRGPATPHVVVNPQPIA